jgi:hypothetical protein
MGKNNQLKRIRYNGSAVIEQLLPGGARAELEDVIRSRRHEVGTNEFLMFMSIRALLRAEGMQNCELNRGQVRSWRFLTSDVPVRNDTLRAGHTRRN